MPCCGFVHVAVMVVLWQTEKQNADEMNHLACQHSGMNETLSRWKKMTRPRLQMGGWWEDRQPAEDTNDNMSPSMFSFFHFQTLWWHHFKNLDTKRFSKCYKQLQKKKQIVLIIIWSALINETTYVIVLSLINPCTKIKLKLWQRFIIIQPVALLELLVVSPQKTLTAVPSYELRSKGSASVKTESHIWFKFRLFEVISRCATELLPAELLFLDPSMEVSSWPPTCQHL